LADGDDGQDLKAKLLELGVPPEKVHLVPRGVDTHAFCPGNQEKARRQLGLPAAGRQLLWVGRMVPVKGLDVLLEACALLRDRGVDFHLYLAGDGPLRKTLEAATSTGGLTKQVSFIGVVPHDRLPDWYRAADLAVLPSLSEGVPNVLREALACGTPFVASRVGGVPELAGEPWGRLVRPGDPAELAEAIARSLSELPLPGPPSVQFVGWEESAEAMLRVIRTLVPPATID
jgi:glycosyltransferase involved in cell wall biosynthesis